jgi:hypothetical protein
LNDLFRNTLSPAQWAVLGAVPLAILALYFLKLKRAPLEVPSTYLWRKSIEDLRVNSLWQRLRQSLLLLLQLLVALLAILAVLRPGWQGTKLTGGRLVFLIDNSASMSTRDGKGDGQGGGKGDGADSESRLAAAKEHVAGLIDQMGSGMTAMIVSFAGEPTVVQPFTSNTRLLRERLATIQPTVGSTDLKGALELASGMATPERAVSSQAATGQADTAQADASPAAEEPSSEADVTADEPATVFIFSDGRFGDVKDFALGRLRPVYVPIGAADTQNLAITALETRRSETQPGQSQAFVQAANYSDEATEAVIVLRRGERLVDARKIEIPAGEVAGATLPIGDTTPAEGEGVLEARIASESLEMLRDRLAIDDVAYAALNDSQASRVLLVTSGNVAVEQALTTGRADRSGEVTVEPPSFLETPSYETRATAGIYDLIVYDRCVPQAAPRSNTVYIGVLPPGDSWRKPTPTSLQPPASSLSVPQIIDWNRSHPLLANVELGNFDIVETLLLTPPAGATTLVDAAEGPIVAVASRNSYEDLVLGFPILIEVDGSLQRNTDWINRLSFPTFWLNVLEYFAARQAVGERSLRPGEAIELRPLNPAAESITVTSPSGKAETLRRRGEQPLVYRLTDEIGVYRVTEGARETRRFAVNLFDPAESDVRLRTDETPEDAEQAAVAAIKIGDLDVAATAGAAPARQELWRTLLIAALCVLVLEWWIYHRRVYL